MAWLVVSGMRERFAALLPAVALAILLSLMAAACGGGDDGGGDTAAPSASGPASQTPTGEPTRVRTAAPDAGPLEKLSAAYLAGVDGKIAYRYKGVNWGQHLDGTWTVYWLGENVREDWLTEVPGYPVTDVSIKAAGDKDNYMCTILPFNTSCLVVTDRNVEDMFFRFSSVEEVPAAVLAGIDDVKVTELPAETIAGVAAQCFDLDVPGRIGVGPKGTEKIKLCFSAEGALLHFKRTVTFTNGNPTAELTAEALEASGATEADFEPIVAPPAS